MSEEPITGNKEEVVPAEEIAEVPAEGAPQGQGSEEQAPRAAGGYRGGTRQREAEGLAAAPRERQRRFKRRRKICAFCIEKARVIDHKEVPKLRRFITERGKIMPRRQTGTCARHQRMLATAIRRARECALLPYVAQ